MGSLRSPSLLVRGEGEAYLQSCEVLYYFTDYLLPCITQMEPGQWRIFVQSHCICLFAGFFNCLCQMRENKMDYYVYDC